MLLRAHIHTHAHLYEQYLIPSFIFLSPFSVDCKIIFAGPRSLGYGFVAFESEAAMLKAIDALNETELDGRKLNVQKALPKGERPAGERRPFRGGRGRGRGRGGRQRRDPPTGEPSKTIIFVGNLPFNVVDDDLVNMFQDFKIAKAHVVRYANGASKGFGFLTMASEEEQTKLLSTQSEVWCDERKLSIRAAYSEGAKLMEPVEHEVLIKKH